MCAIWEKTADEHSFPSWVPAAPCQSPTGCSFALISRKIKILKRGAIKKEEIEANKSGDNDNLN